MAITATTPVILSASGGSQITEASLGGSFYVDTSSRSSTSLTHDIYCVVNSTQMDIGSDIETGASYSIPYYLFTDTNSMRMKIVCKTYQGATLIGSKSVTITIKTPDNSETRPTITSISVSEYNTSLNSSGYYLTGISKLLVSISATPQNGASIVSYSTKIETRSTNESPYIVYDTHTYSGQGFVTGFLEHSGYVAIIATVTDSRGITSSSTEWITVTSYSPPKINSFKVYRCSSDGTANAKGKYLGWNFNVAATPSDNLPFTNTYTAKIYAHDGNLDYPIKTYTDLSEPDDTHHSTSRTFDVDSSYSIILVLEDQIYKGLDYRVASVGVLPSTFTLINFNADGNGIAFGKTSEHENAVEFDLPILCNNKINLSAYDASGLVTCGSLFGARAKMNENDYANNVYLMSDSGYLALYTNGQAFYFRNDSFTEDPYFYAGGDGDAYLGSGYHRWAAVYAKNGMILTSDRNLKTDISNLDEKYLNFAKEIQPVTYRHIDGDRLHTGFIAQDIKELMDKYNIDPLELGAYCKDEDSNGEEHLSLRYSEFIALLFAWNREQEEKLNIMQQEIEELKAALLKNDET